MQEEQNHKSGRATSVSCLDLLAEVPTIPRARSKEAVAKSLSEDSSKGQSKVAKKLVTETELSSSWLYKTMQASINAKFKSPRKSPSIQQTDDLAPVVLQDPDLKPVSVKSSAERTSACICSFATMVAISLCSVAFLASIAAVVYLEVFANRNLTSLHTSETQVDLSDVVLDSRDGSDIIYGFDIDDHEMMQKPSKQIAIKRVNPLNENSDQEKNTDRTDNKIDWNVTEINQYINTAETKIKFQDSETIIYEVKSSESLEHVKSSNPLEDFKGRAFDGNLNHPESSVTDKISAEVIQENQENTFLDSKSNKLMVPPVTGNKGILNEQHPTSERNQLQVDLEEPRTDDKLRFEDFETPVKFNGLEKSDSAQKLNIMPESSHALNKSEIFDIDYLESKTGPNPETNDLFHGNDNVLLVNPIDEGNEIKPVLSDRDDPLKATAQEFQPAQTEGVISSSIHDVDKDSPVKGEHDVDSMVMVVDDPEEDSTDSFISNRNGEISFELPSTGPTVSSTFLQTESVHPVMQENNKPKVIWERQMAKESLPKTSVDIKVSLAEAMKHLQALDVNNKLPTSRKKSFKPKSEKAKKQRERNLPEKQGNTTMEKMQYLQKVRLMLYEHLH